MDPKADPKKSICKFRWSYPVVHISRSELRTCDKPPNIKITDEDLSRLGTDAFLNNPYLLARRKEKLHGIRHMDCSTCSKLEDQGVQSTRTGPDIFEKYVNKKMKIPGSFSEFQFSEAMDLIRADHPDFLEISLGNLCNLKCIYCNPDFSSSWEDEKIAYGEFQKTKKESALGSSVQFESVFWDWFDKIKGGLDRIIFIGGEPLLQPELERFLSSINEKINNSPRDRSTEKLYLNVISNFGVSDLRFDRFVKTIQTFSDKFVMHIESSFECTGSRAEYIRHGLRWSQLEKNVGKILSIENQKIRYGIQMAINNLCITNLLEALQFANHLQHKHNTLVDFKENIVVYPTYLCPLTLTPDFAKYLDDCLLYVEKTLGNPHQSFYSKDNGDASHLRWQQYLPFLQSLRDGILRPQKDYTPDRIQFYKFIRQNDQRRKLNFLKTFPEYSDFYSLCEREFTNAKS